MKMKRKSRLYMILKKKIENRRWPIGPPQWRLADRLALRPATSDRPAHADPLAEIALAGCNGSASRSASATNRLAGR